MSNPDNFDIQLDQFLAQCNAESKNDFWAMDSKTNMDQSSEIDDIGLVETLMGIGSSVTITDELQNPGAFSFLDISNEPKTPEELQFSFSLPDNLYSLQPQTDDFTFNTVTNITALPSEADSETLDLLNWTLSSEALLNISAQTLSGQKTRKHVHIIPTSGKGFAAHAHVGVSRGKRIVQRNKVEIINHTSRRPDPLPEMNSFRFYNDYTLEDFMPSGIQPNGDYNYESTTFGNLTPYSARVYRYKKKGLQFEV
ncbi:hypothetical protein FOA43_000716 [Brettanomyces nanus]|uniref:Uncharacterized protein n=1 Tax=Eeniella nana TaxID=13502 RepID=A0A875RWU5_EENNA|nr:uncharacterized protein FOA43_000716 [Brettanomyces nanus]QPG73406.1 hypothetical protein FOA43_000716 [Brettanomyces nanus]